MYLWVLIIALRSSTLSSIVPMASSWSGFPSQLVSSKKVSGHQMRRPADRDLAFIQRAKKHSVTIYKWVSQCIMEGYSLLGKCLSEARRRLVKMQVEMCLVKILCDVVNSGLTK